MAKKKVGVPRLIFIVPRRPVLRDGLTRPWPEIIPATVLGETAKSYRVQKRWVATGFHQGGIDPPPTLSKKLVGITDVPTVAEAKVAARKHCQRHIDVFTERKMLGQLAHYVERMKELKNYMPF